jgi:ADP-dependent NAD(P)H-hydrate dehydratase / NAD(P)H-hydrate epimerase
MRYGWSAHSIIVCVDSMPVEIYPVAAIREIDRTAIEKEKIPGYTLMKRAGEAAVQAAILRFPDARRWQVICGGGNNGGDGYVVARLAAQQGIAVSVLALVSPESLQGDAATAYGDFGAASGVGSGWSGALDPDSDLLIDAILGSGLERDIAGEIAAVVNAANDHSAPIISLDIPTGLHGDTGEILGCAINAEQTTTFVGLKSGLFLRNGPEYSGALVYDGLEIPESCRDPSLAVMRRITTMSIGTLLPRRARDSHKGDFGHVLVIGGGAGMPGAVRLCGEAALRAGAGRVSIATDPAHAASVVSQRPELMSHGVESADELDALLAKADVVAFGPGLGQSSWASSLYEHVAADQRPSVWDADALNLLARKGGRAANRVITPHPGEAATLLESSTGDVQSDRITSLKNLQDRYGGVVVLKGAGSLVSSAGPVPWVCTAGNPGMAAPGMGDVLTGIIAALMAQGLTAEQAASVGVQAHALAGDHAARAGERGMIASDLLADLRSVLNP